MPNFRHIIRQAYLEILQREPDQGGSDHYNELMNRAEDPLTEAELRDSLMQSQEYADKFPGVTPPPPPVPGSMPPLRVEGNRFFAGGEPISLLGMIICCDDPNTPDIDEAIANGWPSIISDGMLDIMRNSKLNWCHIRTGPFRVRRPGEPDSGEIPENVAYADAGDGRVDLSQWNPNFFSRLRTFISHARARGIYVEIDLMDVWVLDHEVGPWSAGSNVNGFNKGGIGIFDGQLDAIHEAWIRKIVNETKEFENVVYHTGNEMWKARRRGNIAGIVHQMVGIVRELTGTGPSKRLIGDNSDTRHQAPDYWTYHQSWSRNAEEKPVLVNEYPSQAPHVVVAEAAIARINGTAFMYWRGDHSIEQTIDVCAKLKLLVEGELPFPETCPTLVRWQPKVHIVMNRHRQLIESGIPEEGGFVFFDSTPRYGSLPGRPCNNEHNEVCGGRPCEDPRGGRWSLTEGNAQMRVENPGDNGFGYQVLLGPLGPAGSRYTVKVQALDDARDSLGQPLNVAGNHSRTATIVVGERATAAAASEAAVMALGETVNEQERFRPVPHGILSNEEEQRMVNSGGKAKKGPSWVKC